MSAATRWEERLLGFDARIAVEADWTDVRRATFLLRPRVGQPFSVDSTVWPSLFDAGTLSRPEWIGVFQDLWEDLAQLQEHLRAHVEGIAHDLVAVTVHAPREGGAENGLAPVLDGKMHDPRAGRAMRLPLVRPAVRSDTWQLLGYDVCDVWGLSGLMNCGCCADERDALRREWGPRLNDRHLFATVDDAAAFAQRAATRVSEHAPFFVYGLWRIVASSAAPVPA